MSGGRARPRGPLCLNGRAGQGKLHRSLGWRETNQRIAMARGRGRRGILKMTKASGAL